MNSLILDQICLFRSLGNSPKSPMATYGFHPKWTPKWRRKRGITCIFPGDQGSARRRLVRSRLRHPPRSLSHHDKDGSWGDELGYARVMSCTNALSFEIGSAPSTLPGCVLKYYAISVWIFRMSVRADRTGCASPAIADLSIRLGAGLFPTTLAPRRRSFSAGCANAAPADPAKVSNRRRTTNRTRKPAPR